MIRTRQGIALCGAFCVFLLVVTSLLLNGHVEFAQTLLSTEKSQADAFTSPDPSVLDDAPPKKQFAEPSESLRTISRFDGYGLPTAECQKEFGDLFKGIERSAAHRKTNGNVTSSDIDTDWIDDGSIRAMIYRQKLFILESKIGGAYHPPRALSILHQIDRAINASPEPVPDIEFTFVVRDLPDESHNHHTYWSLTGLEEDKESWIMPDFGMWTWPLSLVGAYEQIRTEMLQNEIPWKERIPKIIWRGALKTNKLREVMYQVTRGKEWADIEEVKWKSRTKVASGSVASSLSMADHCGYQFLMHTEGRSYSGRGKYLLNCGSVVVMHKSEWKEPHQDVYVKSGDEQNIVEVERDFSDLEAKMKELLKDPQRAQQIALNSQKTFRDRYLTPAAQACYWRKLFNTWSEVSFRPKPFEMVNGKARLRGIPFETYVVQAIPNPAECSWWQKSTFQC